MPEVREHVELTRYVDLVWSRRHLILTFCLSASLTSLVLTYVFSEKYEAYTTILYRPQEAVSFRPKVQEALGFPPPLVPLETIGNTVEQVAKSDASLAEIVRTLRLDQKRPKADESWFKRAFGSVKDGVKETAGELWQILKHGRVIPKDPFAGAMADLSKNLKVERGMKTYTFRLEVVNGSPELAAQIVDTAAEVLAETLREENTRVARQERERIGERLRQSEGEIQSIREELESFKGTEQVASLGEEVSLRLTSISTFEDELARVVNELRAMEERRRELLSQLDSQEPSLKYSSTVTENPVVEQMKLEQADQEVKKSGLLEVYTEKHPDVREVEARLVQIRDTLNEQPERVVSAESTGVNEVYQKVLSEKLTAEAEIEALRAKRSALVLSIELERQRMRGLTEKEPRFGELTLRLQAAERSYELINEAYEEARIAESKAASELSILHDASVPAAPSRPIKILHVGVSAVLSLILAMGAVFLFDFFDSSVRTVDQVEGLLKVPVLATIPPMPQPPISDEEPPSGGLSPRFGALPPPEGAGRDSTPRP